MATTANFPTRLRTLGMASALVLLAACASVPPPTNLMQRAQQQIDAARDAQAEDYAPVDMTFAEQRYKAAQSAMDAHKYALAQDMAEEARADAQLAQTRAELAAARKEIKNRNAENQRLRKQLLEPAKPSSTAPSRRNSNLPEEITLPQPSDNTAPADDGADEANPSGFSASQGDRS